MRRAAPFACSSLFGIALMVQPAIADSNLDTVTAPQVKPWEMPYMNAAASDGLTEQQVIALLRAKIKYVFIIYQENRSFDSYFGTFPGAAGLYSQPPAQTPGFYQPIVNTDGSVTTMTPFLIGPAQRAWDTDDLDHTHAALVAKMDMQAGGRLLMDKFSETEELKYSPNGNPSRRAKQFGELAMAHEDCNTVPFLWNYADRFVLFDHVFQDMTGASSPGNLSIFAAQSGQTQLALHPSESFTNPAYSTGQGEPVLNNNNPFAGSPADPLKNAPVNPADYPGYNVQLNQAYATIALSLAGGQAQVIMGGDTDKADDLADIQDDISFVAQSGEPEIPWGWYQEGYDQEVTDSAAGPVAGGGSHASYVTDHNAPQFFGYIANNPAERANLHGLGDFFDDISHNRLPAAGVFYLKGGYQNLFGLKPENPLPAVQANFAGDDDHPAYSDAQISEATVAKEVNAIVQSRYWPNAAIIITWSDSEGDYDHLPPPVRRGDQNQSVESFGPRVPLMVISPYAKVHQIAQQAGSQSSVVKFIDEVFARDPLAELPDEIKGEQLGTQEFGNNLLGPLDDDPNISGLLAAFDIDRLMGGAAPLPASFAEIPDDIITHLPQYNGEGCKALGIIPEDFVNGVPNNIPQDFNPLPRTNPVPPA